MKIVRQYQFGQADVLELEETEIPSINSQEVLIKGAYTSVNYADIKTRVGNKGKGVFPFTLGLDIAGVIEDEGDTRFQKGDRVIAFPKSGSYAEYVVAQEALVYKIPDALSFEQAAAMPTIGILAYILLHEIGQVQQEHTIVIHSAAGGVGSMLVQLASMMQVKNIIATVGQLEKADYVRTLGAHYVCTYDDVTDVVLNTNRQGAHVIFDSMAGDITTKSLECLADYGTLVQFGNSSGKSGQISTSDVHSSCRTVRGFSLGTTRKNQPERLAPIAQKVIDLFANGSISIPIHAVFELADVAQAHQLIEGRSHMGKILLKISQ